MARSAPSGSPQPVMTMTSGLDGGTPDVADGVQAVAVGHAHVEKDHVHVLPGGPLQALGEGRGGGGGMAQPGVTTRARASRMV